MNTRNTLSAIVVVAAMAITTGCGSNRNPGRVYMPDMAYSRTYEAYDLLDSTQFTTNPNDKGGRIFFDAHTVPGTIKRGDEFPYTLANDSVGYKLSAAVPNPIQSMTVAEMAEAGRLYNINCGICHGEKGKANGPMSGKVGGIVDLTLDTYKVMADGTMFHSITYGKNNMGSYASQLTRKQRWEVIKYVRTLQGVDKPAATDSSAKAAPVADSATTAKK